MQEVLDNILLHGKPKVQVLTDCIFAILFFFMFLRRPHAPQKSGRLSASSEKATSYPVRRSFPWTTTAHRIKRSGGSWPRCRPEHLHIAHDWISLQVLDLNPDPFSFEV